MKTLIELYDERPVENVISTEVFRPEKTVFLCENTVARDKDLQNRLRQYFRKRKVKCDLQFEETAILDAGRIAETLQRVLEREPDCALDIAGGTDAALFASGLACAKNGVPVFTYSRKRNAFYNIRNAAFAHDLKCDLRFKVEDCLLMAGGAMHRGRVDNAVLARYKKLYDPFFALYLRFRTEWVSITGYIRKISQEGLDRGDSLKAEGPLEVRGEHNSRIRANIAALEALQEIGMIRELETGESGVSFEFPDEQIRAWLRDVGSVLELYIYQCCLDTGLFSDVRTSVVVDWHGDGRPDAVTNEIDVMATAGITPVFISCKTCDVKTEALNELAILRERFGSGIAKAVIVTSGTRGRNVMCNRAAELGIDVIALEDLKNGEVRKKLASYAG